MSFQYVIIVVPSISNGEKKRNQLSYTLSSAEMAFGHSGNEGLQRGKVTRENTGHAVKFSSF